MNITDHNLEMRVNTEQTMLPTIIITEPKDSTCGENACRDSALRFLSDCNHGNYRIIKEREDDNIYRKLATYGDNSTRHSPDGEECGVRNKMAPVECEDNGYRKKDFRRPTLCVIDEHAGSEVTSPDGEAGSNVPFSFPSDRVKVTDHNDNLAAPEVVSEDSDFNQLMATTTRLKLSTRRPSVMAWKQEQLEKRSKSKPCFDNSSAINDDGFTEERRNRINEALEWLRNELEEMRTQDQTLARQLLTIRHDIHQLKLKRSCQEHREMLDDVTQDMEEVQQIHGICDIPLSDSVNDSPLKHLGVTRMHLSARRFSTC